MTGTIVGIWIRRSKTAVPRLWFTFQYQQLGAAEDLGQEDHEDLDRPECQFSTAMTILASFQVA